MDHIKVYVFITCWNFRSLLFIILTTVSGLDLIFSNVIFSLCSPLLLQSQEWCKIRTSLIWPISCLLSAQLSLGVSPAAPITGEPGTYTLYQHQQCHDDRASTHYHHPQGRFLEIMQSFIYSALNTHSWSDFYFSEPNRQTPWFQGAYVPVEGNRVKK